MLQKKVKLNEALTFAKENGYLFAVYQKKENGNFHKVEEAIWDTLFSEDEEIMVKTTGASTDFNEFETVDGNWCFRLHNNFNTPNIIPVIKRGQ